MCLVAFGAVIQLGAKSAEACSVKPKPLAAYLGSTAQSCSHPLCFETYATDPKHVTRATPPDRLVPMCGVEYQNRHAIADALRLGGIVLLGEVHDNAVVHALRAAFVAVDVAPRGLKPGAVFEHIRADQAAALATFAAMAKAVPASGEVGELKRLLDWESSGWAKMADYTPLLQSVVAAKLPMYAGDPPRETIRKVAKEGEAALGDSDRKRLGLDWPLPSAAQEGLLDQLEQSHCGVMPKSAFANLAFAQRYRDAHLADVLLRAAAENGSAILFAGNGHVRGDRGVPVYLRQRAPGKTVVTVMLVEVEDGKTDPEGYVDRDAEGRPIADYIVFVPPAKRPDPCEEMRKRTYAK